MVDVEGEELETDCAQRSSLYARCDDGHDDISALHL